MASVPFQFPSLPGNAPVGLPEALAIFAQRRAQQMPAQQPAGPPQMAGGGFWDSPGAKLPPLPSLAQPQPEQAPQQAMAYAPEPLKPAMPAAVQAMPASAPVAPAGGGGNWWEQFSKAGGGDFLGNALVDLGAGLTQGRDFGEGLGLATQRTAQMGPQRDQQRQQMAQSAERQQTRNATIEWLKANAPRYAAAVEAGALDPGAAWAAALKETGPQGGGEPETFFGNPIPFETEQGVQFGQIGNRGGFRPVQLPEGARFASPTQTVNTETEQIVMDRFGNVLDRLPIQNRQAAQDTAIGKGMGEAQVAGVTGAPQALANADNLLGQIDAVINDPSLSLAVGVGGLLPAVPGTPQAGVVSRIEQLQGQAFLQAFETLKGGGQITEVEGKKATDAIARLQRVQSREDFVRALKDLRDVVAFARQRAAAKGGQLGGQVGGPAAPGGGASDPLGMR